MVILADAQREIGSLKNANVEFDVNNKKMFTVQIARCYWTQSLTFDALVYVPDTEYGGIIGSVLTDTTLDYVELKGYTWRGMLEHKIIQPPGDQHAAAPGQHLLHVLRCQGLGVHPPDGHLRVAGGACVALPRLRLPVGELLKI